MKVLAINSVNYGSTGRIMFAIADLAEEQGHTVYTTSGFTKRYMKRERWFITSHIPAKLFHTYMAKWTGFNGFFSVLPTLKLIAKIKQIKPQLIHLHNLHGWYLNLPLFWAFLKKSKIPVIWTLHDCWAFTGQCPHFTMERCDRWRTGCHDCPQLHIYPATKVDRTPILWNKKREWFTGSENLTIVTPSQWLAGLVKESFLKGYPVKVINNGIGLSVFKPMPGNFRERYHITAKYMVLAVSMGWSYAKGIDVLIKLANDLTSDYQLIIVGTDDATDKLLPANVISIHRTHNQQELAEIYTAADVFVNPTRQDTFPTVNIEALACGTPVITFDTGGSPEILDASCGLVVSCDDVDAMEKAIQHVCVEKPFSQGACCKRAQQFDMDDRFEEYIRLYEQISQQSRV